MLKNRLLLLLLLALLLSQKLHADSPITSTPFSLAYSDYQIIMNASEANGVLNDQLIEYILRDDVAVDIKMAVINKLSWDIEGKNNSKLFLNYLIENSLYKNEKQFRSLASGDELLAYAYLLAMDDYFDVEKAVEYADLAITRSPNSITYIMIEALIKAQHGIWSKWCSVYELNDEDANWDMKDDALRIIFRYMNLYRGKVKDY